jgi:hypothetical protein
MIDGTKKSFDAANQSFLPRLSTHYAHIGVVIQPPDAQCYESRYCFTPIKLGPVVYWQHPVWRPLLLQPRLGKVGQQCTVLPDDRLVMPNIHASSSIRSTMYFIYCAVADLLDFKIAAAPRSLVSFLHQPQNLTFKVFG